MKPGTRMDPLSEQNRSAGDHKNATRFSHLLKSHTKILYELAAAIIIIGIASYYIFGISPQKTTAPNSSFANSAPSNPTLTSTAGSSAPSWNGPAVQVLSVTPDNSSVKISFKPFPGAKDYRIFDVSEPTVVKYAGMAHLEGGPFLMNQDGTPVVPFQQSPDGNGPGILTIPYPQIEWNLLEGGQPHTLVVQAVDQLGPVPPGNLYNDDNTYLTPKATTGANTLGMNEGPTPDGHISINGQGPSTDNPKVIAQSKPFGVQANPKFHPIPSISSATQTFFDSFDDSEASSLKQISSQPDQSSATYSLNAGTDKEWTIEYLGADVRDSYPMIEGGHFMDVLFDGGTPGSGMPLHTQYGLMTMTPTQTVDFSSGKVLHLTMEVDLHQDSRRWTGIELSPVDDPLMNFENLNRTSPNRSGQALFFNYSSGGCTADILTGLSAGSGSAPNGTRFWGASGQAENVCDLSNVYWGGTGINLDNRGRLDLFITENEAALFINGKLVMESPIPGGVPFTKAKVYFTHYVYHTTNDQNELKEYAPYETFWINYFPWSDERHWDNMGFETFPASAAPTSADWAKLVASPDPVRPALDPSGTGTGSDGNTNIPSHPPEMDTLLWRGDWRS